MIEMIEHLQRYSFNQTLWHSKVRSSNALHLSKVNSCSVDPQKNRRNYLITLSILNFLTPRRCSSQHRSFDIIIIYVSAVGPKTKKLAVLP